MKISDDIKKIRQQISGINRRLNGIRASGGGGGMVAHSLTGTYHTEAGLTTGDFLKAISPTDFAFAPHGLSAADVGAADIVHNHSGVYEPAYAAADATKYYRGDKTWQTLSQIAGNQPFVDNFADASIFADWIQYGTSGSDRTIVESGGHLILAAVAGQDCSYYYPRAFLPVPYYPCEIETKLAVYNKGERTLAGIFIGPAAHEWGSSVNDIFFDQIYSSGDGLNSVRVEGNGGTYATAANSTVPKWFKIRCMGAYQYAQWFFYYSTDGTTWTLLYTKELQNPLGGLCCGLFVGNWYNQPAVSAEFEYFTINPYTFIGPG